MLEKVVHEIDHFWDHLTEQPSVKWSINDLPVAARLSSLHFDSGFLHRTCSLTHPAFLSVDIVQLATCENGVYSSKAYIVLLASVHVVRKLAYRHH